MGMIRVSDDTAKKLKKIGDGRSMTAAINMLIEKVTDGEDEKVMKAINNLGEKIDAVERAVKEIQVYKPEPVVVPTPAPSVSPATVTYETYEKSDKTYNELINELGDLQEEYNELNDKDSDRGKELVNKIRAINVDLSLADEE